MAESGLEQLIETERRLADRLSAATAAAGEIVAAARQAADEADRRFDAELAAAAEEVAVRVAADRDGEIAAIRSKAATELARLRSFSDDAITAVASSLLERVVAARSEEGGP